MATAETVELNAPHAPKEASITAFTTILPELKSSLIHARKSHDKHEPEYFSSVSSLSDAQLSTFSEDDLKLVRVGTSAYGLHLFGKVRLPETSGGYIHFRAFVGGNVAGDATDNKTVNLHCIHTEETEDKAGGKKYRAIFTEGDALEWFDT
ncbi:MAG: hypothetical protein M1832_004901 [Thelocarpon impressellum]|nr:MAG: hypothetical protein M1832_004901 [Thelocarpon impressellum]